MHLASLSSGSPTLHSHNQIQGALSLGGGTAADSHLSLASLPLMLERISPSLGYGTPLSRKVEPAGSSALFPAPTPSQEPPHGAARALVQVGELISPGSAPRLLLPSCGTLGEACPRGLCFPVYKRKDYEPEEQQTRGAHAALHSDSQGGAAEPLARPEGKRSHVGIQL